MSLHRLGNGDGLQSIGDLYGVHKSSLSKIVRKFCRVVRKYLQSVFLQTLDESQFGVLARRFEQLHGIHILVQAPVVGGEDRCRILYQLEILQGTTLVENPTVLLIRSR